MQTNMDKFYRSLHYKRASSPDELDFGLGDGVLVITLLRHNSHTIQFTHLKCTFSGFYIHKVLKPLPQSILEQFHHPQYPIPSPTVSIH